MSDAEIVLVLPMPPSANRMWRNVVINGSARVLKSAEYRSWADECAWKVAIQRAADRVPGSFKVRITLPPTRGDIDNYCKGTLDLLQRSRVVLNDKLCREVTMRRDDAREPGSMLVEVWVMPDPEPVKKTRKPRLKLAAPQPPLH